jgi:hypothetical protein
MTPMRMLLLLSGGSAFSPLSLYAGGVVGAWYDPSDLSTMFQNSNGTTAVAVGDPVGYIADKSGNGKHATQATAAARPILRQDAGGRYYLEFDGSNDGLATAAINFTATDKMTVIAGIQFSDAAGFDGVWEIASSASPGSAWLYSSTQTIEVKTRGATGIATGLFASSVTAAANAVYTAGYDLAGANVAACTTLRRNGAAIANTGAASTAGGGNFANGAITIGYGVTVRLTGRIYGLIFRGAASTAAEIANGETWMNGKTAAY